MVTKHAWKDNWILAFPYDKMLRKKKDIILFHIHCTIDEQNMHLVQRQCSSG